MSSGLLPDHIGPLVDRLRSGDHLPIALPDVAAVTEVLMRSLESYFKSIDLTLYKECQELADYIKDARSEITSLSSEDSDSVGIPRAGLELDAIVEATESATDTIMQAAEDIMANETEDFTEYKTFVNDELMKIFEACSFQDITGQRISKVVKTLNDVENRVGKLISILGVTSSDITTEDTTSILKAGDEEIDENDLLNGPALSGEGIDQSEIDDLLGNTDAAPDPEIEIEIEIETDENAVEVSVEEEKIEASDDVEEEEVEASAPTAEVTENTKKTEDTKETSQEDIDNLFG